MHDQNDSVNRVLNTLRSREWTGESYNPELEEKLMQQFSMNEKSLRRGRYKTIIAALGVVVVGSAGFAAAGGVAGLKSWLVRVNVAGQTTEVRTDENGEASFSVETADGPADVNVKTWQDAGEKGARVVITKDQGDGMRAEVAEKLVQRTSDAADLASFPMEALDGAQPSAEWPDGQGGTLQLYLLPGENPEGPWRLVLAGQHAQGAVFARLVGALPAEVISADPPPQVRMDEDGMAVITAQRPDGKEVVLKIKALSHDQAVPGPIKVNSQLGEIEIGVEEAPEEE